MAALRKLQEYKAKKNQPPLWEPVKDELVTRVDLAGFPPSRIQMDQKGNELYLHGRDVSTDMKHKVREFEQHIPIAEDIDRETIHISGFANGRLVIGARRSSSVSD